MSEQRIVTVVCRVCQTRLDEEAASEPRESICPVCQSLVIVPAASASTKPASVLRTEPDLEGYAVLPLEGAEAEARAKKAQDVILVLCPICRARLHSPPRKEAYHIKCHDCHELVRVPSRAEHRAKQKRDAIPDRLESVEPVPIGRAEVAERTYSSWYLKAHGEIRREPDAQLPEHLFLSGTMTFPWEREIFMKWVFLSLGTTFFSLVSALLVALMSEGYAPSGLATGFFALPLIWGGIWTVSYAASVCMAIVTDTANGNQRIVNWAEQNWRDWIITMAYVQYLAAVAALAGYVTTQLLRLAGVPSSLPGLVVSAAAFPYVVLSALETGGGLNFLSANVTLTLAKKPLPWLSYYIIAGGLTIGVAASIWGLLLVSPLLAGAAGGVLVAAWLLIQARLLGRLAWAISRE